MSNLEKFVGTKRVVAELVQTQTSVDRWQIDQIMPPVEYPPQTNELLYKTLLQHSNCTCLLDDSGSCSVQRHWTRLRLVDKARSTQEDIFFDMVFSTTPATPPPEVLVKWQQLRFELRLRRKRQIHFADQELLEPNYNEEEEITKVIEAGHFCDLLGRSLGNVCIRLRIVDGCLHQLFQADAPDRRVVEAPSISLSQVLQRKNISSKGRILLAYILAKSVWRYYDSDFMRMHWATETIHFMREYRLNPDGDMDQEKIDPSSPFFAFAAPETGQNEYSEHCQSYSVLHRYPRILALGIMLVEICLTKPRQTHGAAYSDAQLNTDFTTYQEVAKSTNWPGLDVRNEEIRNKYRAAAQSCLDPKLFHVPHQKNSRENDVQIRRDILYKRVIFPLEQLCAEMGIINQPDMVELLDYALPKTEPQNLLHTTLLSGNQKTSLPKSSKEWLDWTMNTGTLNLAQRYRNNPQLRRIRIAVLDTGYDRKSSFFYPKPRSNRLCMWEDFVGGSAQPLDNDGHGTHVVSLAMKMAPAADICVARVATSSADLGKASQSIAKAIKWAAETAEADIISMSFGFSEEIEVDDTKVISNAIAQALSSRNQRILFFAAAANDGGNQLEMFPAQHSSVFSIRGTDHQGTFLPLNPPPDFAGVDVFGTLGKDVPGASLCHESGELCSTGTSIATPIAAGIAATTLGYARLRIEGYAPLHPSLISLWTERGMRSMLLKLSRKMGEKIYYLSADEFLRNDDSMRDALLLVSSREARRG
ncbi:peptidase S8/S53 domain-containing protein [Massariosphaeria phaeospora]|uniref:Peptidase S8/S53 domain-containing protein n=1 Tax=Massariosphaeria phaeospora TaxID=100035 RepID=A0A7C8IHK3_9PLEO|nr:peptidase S8/S53 domain-containing protein [Massariosphaeria phaeospora]